MRCSPAFLSLLLAAAACGGGSKSATTTPANQATDGAPADHAALQAEVAGLPVTAACDNGEAATLGALFAAQRELLGSDDSVDESFDCQPPVDGEAECTWSVFTRPTGGGDPCGEDDPCGGEGGGSGYQIIVKVDAAGHVIADSATCVAPG